PNIPDTKPTASPIARIRKMLTGRSAMGRKICTNFESLSRRADHNGHAPGFAALTAFCLPKSKAAGDREYSKSTAKTAHRGHSLPTVIVTGLVPVTSFRDAVPL